MAKTYLSSAAWRLSEWMRALESGEAAHGIIAEMYAMAGVTKPRTNADRAWTQRLAETEARGLRGAEALNEAEALMCDQGITPPHWQGVVDCFQCSIVPAPAGGGERVGLCPWCNTEAGRWQQKALHDPDTPDRYKSTLDGTKWEVKPRARR